MLRGFDFPEPLSHHDHRIQSSRPSETEERDVIALSATGGVAPDSTQNRLTGLAGLGRGGGKGLLQTFDAKQPPTVVHRLVHAIGVEYHNVTGVY
jgi:hypothetical protein